ncbi:hypothetical protein BDR03DRAFT_1000610 [Suillus americanus]|nr:hypothetical protein BDR03DRAFT_1000610 [Suillus americanus]
MGLPREDLASGLESLRPGTSLAACFVQIPDVMINPTKQLALSIKQCSSDSPFQSKYNQQIISSIERTIMVFYAYVKQVTDNSTYRYVITFASRSVADEWWRAVSTSSVVSFTDSIQRVNAQFYTHNVNQANAANSLTTTGVATQFLGDVFFTLLNDLGGRGLSIIPSLDHFADHISGDSFFIRSKVSPYKYWYCPQSSDAPDGVYVSHTERTRFRVSRTDSGTAGTIMIGSDEIDITLTTVDMSINVITSTGQVIVSTAPMSGLKFGDLLNKFTTGTNVQSLDARELIYTDDGEEWELA